MQSFYILLLDCISIYMWLVIVGVILSWLIQFNVINSSNRFVYLVATFINRATEPVLTPIRSVLPDMGGLDISPVILILLLVFVRNLIQEYGLGSLLYSSL